MTNSTNNAYNLLNVRRGYCDSYSVYGTVTGTHYRIDKMDRDQWELVDGMTEVVLMTFCTFKAAKAYAQAQQVYAQSQLDTAAEYASSACTDGSDAWVTPAVEYANTLYVTGHAPAEFQKAHPSLSASEYGLKVQTMLRTLMAVKGCLSTSQSNDVEPQAEIENVAPEASEELIEVVAEEKHSYNGEIKTLRDLNAYIDVLASDWDGEQDLHDFCHEQADGSEYVIYYGKAWQLVDMIRWNDRSIFDAAEDAAFNHGTTFESADQMMTLIAYEIIYQELSLAVQELEQEMAA